MLKLKNFCWTRISITFLFLVILCHSRIQIVSHFRSELQAIFFSFLFDFMFFRQTNNQELFIILDIWSFSFRTPSHFFSFLFDFMFFRQTNDQVLFIILDIRSFSLPTPSHFFSFLFDFMLFRQTFCHLISSSNFVESGACPKYFW
jgi:hypothetical protein